MTNNKELFDDLVMLGQHPKEMSDAVTIMEKIGHFLDDAVAKIYRRLKKEGVSKIEASTIIGEKIDIIKVLKKASKDWDWRICNWWSFGAWRCFCCPGSCWD